MTPPEARSLARDLAARVQGEVRFDAGSRALYAHDLSIYRQVPIGVVVPRDAEDAVAAVEVCRRHEAPVLPRGAGTSLVGQCTNAAVVLDFSKSVNAVLELDPDARLARVEPGVICDQLKAEAEAHGLTYGPDPATHAWCTAGGMVGNNSCGVHSVLAELYGQGPRTSDQVEELTVLTYDGHVLRVGRNGDAGAAAGGGREAEIHRRLRELGERYGDLVRERYPDIPRRVSGYNLDDLLPERGFHVARSLVGSEGTCAVVLEATLRLVEWPPARVLLVAGYPDHFAAADDVPGVLAHRPIGLEGFDASVTETMEGLGLFRRERAVLPDGRAWLLVELGGATRDDAVEQAEALARELGGRAGAPSLAVMATEEEQAMVWLVRESALGASRLPGKFETWPSFEDSAVHPSRLGDYLRDFKKVLDRHGLRCVYFGHYGQGCVHCRINFDLRSREGLATFRRFLDEASELVLSYGGSLSGEHGDGQAHAHHLERMFGPELVDAFREFKRIWDPDWKMNPGKLVDAYAVDENLRISPDYRPRRLATYFSFPEDGGSFAAATERCFGMGKCRRVEGGTMCPSFMATREEAHTTRGRAHLLFELVRGEVIGRDGWREEAVKEALDLCLACKGCKADCPVSVDIATYKAEFLAHWYERRLRPPAAYAMGLIDVWARLAAHAPGLVNFLGRTEPFAGTMKRAAGLAPERDLPAFASPTFTEWFRGREPRGGGSEVILWPDTFSNHFHPGVARAAVEALEAAGFAVRVPVGPLCCGRPLYDFGMLDRARRYLRRVLETLGPALRSGARVVVLEPSCLAVFKDELGNLLPGDADARRLREQSMLLSELLLAAGGWEAPALGGAALHHGHCHQKALLGTEPDEELLARLGLDVQTPDTGCCGLAGSFGYERGDHYEVSMKVGERVLLPAVRAAPPEALVVASGFSCRQQIAHATNRRALHVAEVVQLALRGAGHAPPPDVDGRPRRAGLLAAGVVAVGGAVAARALTRSR
ncbi:MAG TPA: FAD-binding and (Fe-S)-binding domain-containing protein [Gaiellaceae bacterium]|nr:FAD-binding and (Fe-S)-binding domain-containing protein [Gaiellaceae bacterium]